MSLPEVETRLRIPQTVLRDTFAELRRCGAGRRECQVVWTGPWVRPWEITSVVHPRHHARGDGFEVDSGWLTSFYLDLAQTATGARVQIHTHPHTAFHSSTDDAWPLIHTPGFLSLVIPDFAQGEIGLREAYLTEIGDDGEWNEVSAADRLEIIA